MEKLIQKFKGGAIQGFGFFFTATLFLIGFYFVKGTFTDGQILDADSLNKVSPSGEISAFNLTTCPTGRKSADGTDGTPDLRGQFLRGLNTFDNGHSTRSDGKQDPDNDKDGNTRTIGSLQLNEIKSHAHDYQYMNLGNGANNCDACTEKKSNYGPIVKTSFSGGSETRPNNVAVIYCIKK